MEQGLTRRAPPPPALPPQANSRAFTRLVGRETSTAFADCTADQLIAIHQIPSSVVREVRKTIKRREAGIVDYEKDYASAAVQFQEYAFDPHLRGVKNRTWERTPLGRRVSSSRTTGSKGAYADRNNDGATTLDHVFDGHTSAETGLHVEWHAITNTFSKVLAGELQDGFWTKKHSLL
jgi:hypothetical protein